MNKHNRLAGFTIVELIVVISIIGILTAITITTYTQVQKKGRDATRQSDITLLQNELEKFYDKNGVYPPGCPASSCTVWLLTDNTSSPMITSDTTLPALTSALPGISASFGDPLIDHWKPIMGLYTTQHRYYYYGGTVNNQYTGPSVYSYDKTSYFPCSINTSLKLGEVGSYVVGYYSEATGKWVLNGGRHGVPMTIKDGDVNDGCVINS